MHACQPVLIVGLGAQGIALARLARQQKGRVLAIDEDAKILSELLDEDVIMAGSTDEDPSFVVNSTIVFFDTARKDPSDWIRKYGGLTASRCLFTGKATLKQAYDWNLLLDEEREFVAGEPQEENGVWTGYTIYPLPQMSVRGDLMMHQWINSLGIQNIHSEPVK